MGTNHSHLSEPQLHGERLGGSIKSGLPAATTEVYSKWTRHLEQGKPSPPSGAPVTSDITHNSVMLSWQPKRGTNGNSIIAYTVKMFIVKDRQWVTLTKTCQGNSYQVRNLEPNTEYQFRVKAENIYGRSKAGGVSEIVHTNNLMFQDCPSPSVEKKVPSLKRHRSVNIQVEGTVASILNHSDSVVRTSVSADALNEAGTLQRENGFRSSLQSVRKRSMPSMFPGNKRESLTKLKGSQSNGGSCTLSDTEKSSDTIAGSISKNNSSEKFGSHNESESRLDSQSSGSDVFTLDSGDYCETHGGERKQVSDEILAAPISDDYKLVLSKNIMNGETEREINDNRPKASNKNLSEKRSTIRENIHSHDFRTLRQMLNSDDMIKPTRSLPEISKVYTVKSQSEKKKLSTIVDEDDDSVRMTTL